MNALVGIFIGVFVMTKTTKVSLQFWKKICYLISYIMLFSLVIQFEKLRAG